MAARVIDESVIGTRGRNDGIILMDAIEHATCSSDLRDHVYKRNERVFNSSKISKSQWFSLLPRRRKV